MIGIQINIQNLKKNVHWIAAGALVLGIYLYYTLVMSKEKTDGTVKFAGKINATNPLNAQ